MIRLLVWMAALLPVAVVLALGSYTAVAGPRCASCHDEARFAAATAASPHAKTACASCHVGRSGADVAAFRLGQTTGMVVPLAPGGREAAAVPDERCLSCHARVREAAVTSANGLRIAHATCAAGSTCTDCHSSTAHGVATSWVRTYDMESCLACHAKTGSTKCDLCHAGKRPADRVTTGVFATTHGPQWRSTHGMGKSSTCSACHTVATCGKCHGAGLPHDKDFIEGHSTIAQSSAARCSSCHSKSFCDDCHGTPMPHPRAFVEQHARAAEASRASCSRCHAKQDCTTCHEKHVHPGGAVATGAGAR